MGNTVEKLSRLMGKSVLNSTLANFQSRTRRENADDWKSMNRKTGKQNTHGLCKKKKKGNYSYAFMTKGSSSEVPGAVIERAH